MKRLGLWWLYIAAGTWAVNAGLVTTVAVVTGGWSRAAFVVVFSALASVILAVMGAACQIVVAIERLRQPEVHVEMKTSEVPR